ncbi:uncharacterized protein LOC131219575 isoform X2 [Magnolia sinica]|uniref:uncharacterized protein LOC131219575 isoform X2 n=1 Tax=Magnolia sinica TaxID=86752 RepID=UPI002659ED6F|nr:uncharacterized protein LOC131219575 isoform X2 [Magnolia sinica]
MAMQSGVSTSKVLILVGAGLTSSVILRSGRLSDVISDLQELIKGVNEIEVSPNRFDSAFLAAQIRHLAQEVRDLTLSRPVTIFNGNSTSNGNLSSYIMPAAAIGAMGYCYMWWKGWSFSDVMFVTKKNMANAVASVSKQLEQVSAALASTKRHLTQRLENLDGKLDEQKEISKVIMNEVDDVRSDLSQIGFDIELIQKIVSGLEDKIGVLEDKQDFANAGVWYLCQIAGGIKDGLNTKFFQDYSAKLPLNHPKTTFSEEKSLKAFSFPLDIPTPPKEGASIHCGNYQFWGSTKDEDSTG